MLVCMCFHAFIIANSFWIEQIMRVVGHHWAVLLDFCEKNPQIITNKFSGAHSGREEHKKLWEQLITMLNSLGYGEKSLEEWKKALTDWKSKTKAKAANLQKSQNKTGGGPSSTHILTDYEERLLCLMGKTAVDGNPTVMEIGIPSVNTMQEIPATVQKPQMLNVNLMDEIQIVTVNTPFFLESSSNQLASSAVGNSNFESPQQENLESDAKRPRKQLKTNPKHNITKNQRDVMQVKQMNDQVLVVLNKINDNMSTLNTNFARLLDLFEKQKG